MIREKLALVKAEKAAAEGLKRKREPAPMSEEEKQRIVARSHRNMPSLTGAVYDLAVATDPAADVIAVCKLVAAVYDKKPAFLATDRIFVRWPPTLEKICVLHWKSTDVMAIAQQIWDHHHGRPISIHHKHKEW